MNNLKKILNLRDVVHLYNWSQTVNSQLICAAKKNFTTMSKPKVYITREINPEAFNLLNEQ